MLDINGQDSDEGVTHEVISDGFQALEANKIASSDAEHFKKIGKFLATILAMKKSDRDSSCLLQQEGALTEVVDSDSDSSFLFQENALFDIVDSESSDMMHRIISKQLEAKKKAESDKKTAAKRQETRAELLNAFDYFHTKSTKSTKKKLEIKDIKKKYLLKGLRIFDDFVDESKLLRFSNLLRLDTSSQFPSANDESQSAYGASAYPANSVITLHSLADQYFNTKNPDIKFFLDSLVILLIESAQDE
ncbi:hypothetical protein ACH42_02280 [Endozoicomonas sp. (ex Bugula neritina AB1)]|nr:hypothetical protein ACH42_02280 [Endozoicomonas sp. (ex Bugula neritina AB1)]